MGRNDLAQPVAERREKGIGGQDGRQVAASPHFSDSFSKIFSPTSSKFGVPFCSAFLSLLPPLDPVGLRSPRVLSF